MADKNTPISDYEKFGEAWENFITVLAKELRLDVFLTWLNNKLVNIKWLN